VTVSEVACDGLRIETARLGTGDARPHRRSNEHLGWQQAERTKNAAIGAGRVMTGDAR